MMKKEAVGSLREQVFHTIRDNILEGQYQESMELKESTIGKELGVSRTPVREALRQLELEGLVTIIPNRGAFVSGLSSKDIRDIYEARYLLEGLCARWAAEKITSEQIEKMEEVLLLSQFHVGQMEQGKKDQMVALDGSFHELLYEASGSRMLSRVLMDYHRYLKLSRKTSVHRKDRARKSLEEHRQILEALKEKNKEKAETLAKLHISHVIENLEEGEKEHEQN